MDDQTPHVKKQFHSYGNAADGDQHECNTVGMTWPRVDQRMFTENFKLAQKDQFDIIEGDDVEQEVDQRNSREFVPGEGSS